MSNAIGVYWAPHWSSHTRIVVLSGTREAPVVEEKFSVCATLKHTVEVVADYIVRHPQAEVYCDCAGSAGTPTELLRMALPSRRINGVVRPADAVERLGRDHKPLPPLEGRYVEAAALALQGLLPEYSTAEA